MSERERERRYWRLFLLFALASPISVYSTATAGYSPSFSPVPFTLIAFLAIPFTVLVELLLAALLGGPTRVWIVRPTARAGRALALSAERCRDEVVSRLHESRFDCAASKGDDGAEVLAFGKAKSQPVCSFLDNAFFGELSLKPSDSGTSLTCSVTFNDTVILDTGEAEKLRQLCDYLSLRSREFSYENVPLTLYCGLTLSFLTAAFTLTGHRALSDMSLTCLSLASAGLLAGGMFHLLKDRGHLFGQRLFFGGLSLAAIPFAGKLVALAAGWN